MKRKFYLMYLLIPAACLLCVNVGFSQDLQDSLKTWQQQMEYLKNKTYISEIWGETNWQLIGYTYKGVIDSETTKSAVIDSICSPDANFPLFLSSIVVVDTTYSEDTCIITKKRYPKLESFTGDRQGLKNLIQIGWEYLNTEWSNQGNKYSFITIVPNKNTWNRIQISFLPTCR